MCLFSIKQSMDSLTWDTFIVYSYKYQQDDGRVSYPLCFIFSSPVGKENTHSIVNMHKPCNMRQSLKLNLISQDANLSSRWCMPAAKTNWYRRLNWPRWALTNTPNFTHSDLVGIIFLDFSVSAFSQVFEIRNTEDLTEEWLREKLGFFR